MYHIIQFIDESSSVHSTSVLITQYAYQYRCLGDGREGNAVRGEVGRVHTTCRESNYSEEIRAWCNIVDWAKQAMGYALMVHVFMHSTIFSHRNGRSARRCWAVSGIWRDISVGMYVYGKQ